MSKTRLLGLIGFLLFCIGVIFFTFNRHSKTGRFNYHSEIYADRAGYYVYLPAMFQYQFNPKKFPSGINEKIGEGFHYNTDSTRVITKYTYGVALMQLPFYLIAQTISYSQGTPSDGFSILNHKMVNLACVFYFLASLVILFRTFSNLYSNRTLLIVFGLIFLGTNLHYYAIFDTGMSHMYSFFLHSCVISLFYKTEFLKKIKRHQFFFIGFLVGGLILLRPINILFLSSFFFLSLESKQEFLQRVRRVLNLKLILVIIVCVIIVWLPQVFYWKYTFNSFLHYAYGEERFNWLSPRLDLSLFSPNNGLFTNNPIYAIFLLMIVFINQRYKLERIGVLLLYGVLMYVLSCWWNWWFGCSFGARNYVEFLPILMISLFFVFSKVKDYGVLLKLSLGSLIILCCVVNLKLIYTYDSCFFYADDLEWNWKAWEALLFGPIK